MCGRTFPPPAWVEEERGLLGLEHGGVDDVVAFLAVVIWDQRCRYICAKGRSFHIAESSFAFNRSLFSCLCVIAAWLSVLHLLFIYLLEPAAGRGIEDR